MLDCLGSAMPGRERIISVDEVFELRDEHLYRPGSSRRLSDRGMFRLHGPVRLSP
jgi:hypothetical protein